MEDNVNLMRDKKNLLEKKFSSDANKIAETLIDIFGLRHSKNESHLNEPMLRWLDFRLRYISQKPRVLYESCAFPKKLDEQTAQGFRHLKQLFISGGDVNPYQGKGLTLFDDTSSDKPTDRTDLLWADWGIHHFHLNPNIQNGYYSDRSGALLFCLIDNNTVRVINILDHSNFSNQSLIETMNKSWSNTRSEIFEDSELSQKYTDDDIAILRKNRITPVVIGSMGLGVTTAATSAQVSMELCQLRKFIYYLADCFSKNNHPLNEILLTQGITDPNFELSVVSNGLAVIEQKSKAVFVIEDDKLIELFLPIWARKQLNNSNI
jgi:hypothetical protein